jgi:hypothetical protein
MSFHLLVLSLDHLICPSFSHDTYNRIVNGRTIFRPAWQHANGSAYSAYDEAHNGCVSAVNSFTPARRRQLGVAVAITAEALRERRD